MALKVPLFPRVPISIAYITVFWVILQIVGAVYNIGGDGANVSFWAHLGGFLAGLSLSAVFSAPDLGQRALGHAVLDAMNLRSPAAALEACRKHLEAHPNDPKALRDMARAAQLMDDADAEREALFSLLDVLPEFEQAPILVRLSEMGLLRHLPPLQRTLIVERVKSVDPELAEILLLSVVAEPVEEPQRPEAMLALAALKWESNKPQAESILKQLLATYPLHATVELARRRGWLA
jgi:hypothetical protein